MKKTKKIMLGIFASLIIFGILIYLNFDNIFQISYLPKTSVGFTQYEGTACGTLQCDYIYGKLLTSNTFEIYINNNWWKVTNVGGGWGDCGTYGGGYILGGCCTTTDVYKNNVLIDTIKQGYTNEYGEKVNTDFPTRVYCDEIPNMNNRQAYILFGAFDYDNCQDKGKIGIGVYPKRWSSSVNSCNNRQNDYQIFLPNGTFSVETTSDKNAYIQGDVLFFNVKIDNKLADTKIKLKMNYLIPTIFGNKEYSEEKEMFAKKGLNILNFSIATPKALDSLTITPELEIYYNTSYVKGVNFNYPEGLKPIYYKDWFLLGNLKDAPFTLNVTPNIIIINKTLVINNITYRNVTQEIIKEVIKNVNITQYVNVTRDVIKEVNIIKTCKDYGCPKNYVCSNNGFCEEINNYRYILYGIGLAIILFIVIIIFRALGRK